MKSHLSDMVNICQDYLAVAFAVFQWLLLPSARPKQFSTSIASDNKRQMLVFNQSSLNK